MGRLIQRDTIPSPGLAVVRKIARPAYSSRSTASPWPCMLFVDVSGASSAWTISPISSRFAPPINAVICAAFGIIVPSSTSTRSVAASGRPFAPKATRSPPANRPISARVCSLGTQPSLATTRQEVSPANPTSLATRAAAGTPATRRSAWSGLAKAMMTSDGKRSGSSVGSTCLGSGTMVVFPMP